MEFLRTLGESKLLPTMRSLESKDPHEIAEITYYYILALRILLLEDDTHEWAKGYAKKAAEWGDFKKWRANGNDLYVLLHGLSGRDHPSKTEKPYPIDLPKIHRWLKDSGRDADSEVRTQRVLMRIDFDLKMKNTSGKALRRRVLDWDDTTPRQQVATLEKIIAFFQSHASRAEILKHLKDLKKDEKEDLDETVVAPPKSFLSYLQRNKP
ncbi:MAG: hypothetical protein EOP83_18840 [Verrucomicrobiaceae bacterium]|nr:MAG: hypothetical protein EOP83_18840 [Verrucomicrobiaceae bacterium]